MNFKFFIYAVKKKCIQEVRKDADKWLRLIKLISNAIEHAPLQLVLIIRDVLYCWVLFYLNMVFKARI